MIFDFCQCYVGCRRSNKQFISKKWVRPDPEKHIGSTPLVIGRVRPVVSLCLSNKLTFDVDFCMSVGDGQLAIARRELKVKVTGQGRG